MQLPIPKAFTHIDPARLEGVARALTVARGQDPDSPGAQALSGYSVPQWENLVQAAGEFIIMFDAAASGTSFSGVTIDGGTF